MSHRAHVEWNQWVEARPGVDFTLYEYAPGKHTGKLERNNIDSCVEFDFTLSGAWLLDIQYPGGQRKRTCTEAGHSGFSCFFRDTEHEGDTTDIATSVVSTENLSGLLVNVDSNVIPEVAPLRQRLAKVDDCSLQIAWGAYAPMLPAMRMVIQQILVPPLGGCMSRLYLESKLLELVALKVAQCKNNISTRAMGHSISPEDMRSLKLARQILLSDLTAPPSIKELAHRVGINDNKLKYSYKKVFGDTVYGTLRKARMEKARQLFDINREAVLDVANKVGYANPSHFAAAFRKCFGVTPKVYLLQGACPQETRQGSLGSTFQAP